MDLFRYMDQFKFLFYPNQWSNVFLDCSKNEIFALLYLYRNSGATMSAAADYLNVPLNTATGVVTRLEKKGMVERIRDVADRRVVMIQMTDTGRQFLNLQLGVVEGCLQELFEAFTQEETETLFRIADKVLQVVAQKNAAARGEFHAEKRVRRIEIE